MIPFRANASPWGVVQLLGGTHHLVMEGASEILTQKSTCYVIVHHDGANDVRALLELRRRMVHRRQKIRIDAPLHIERTRKLCWSRPQVRLAS